MPIELWKSTYFSFFFQDVTLADAITSEHKEVHANENENMTLSCRYSSAYSLLWYRQHHSSAPHFLMLILQSSGKVIQSSDERLSGKLNVEKNRVDLEIPSSTVQDSALYFCALQTTVTGNHTLLYKNLTA